MIRWKRSLANDHPNSPPETNSFKVWRYLSSSVAGPINPERVEPRYWVGTVV